MFDVALRAEQLEAVQLRDLAFRGDDGTGEAVVLAEVRVPRCDDATYECPVSGVVQKLDYLLRYRPSSFPSAVRGDNEHKRPCNPDQPLHPWPQRNTNRGPVEPVDEATSVLRNTRKEHQIRRPGGGKFVHRGRFAPGLG